MNCPDRQFIYSELSERIIHYRHGLLSRRPEILSTHNILPSSWIAPYCLQYHSVFLPYLINILLSSPNSLTVTTNQTLGSLLLVYRLFAPRTVRPMDVSLHVWTLRPMGDSPHDVSPHTRHSAPWTSMDRRFAPRTGGETSIGESSKTYMGRTVRGAKSPDTFKC